MRVAGKISFNSIIMFVLAAGKYGRISVQGCGWIRARWDAVALPEWYENDIKHCASWTRDDFSLIIVISLCRDAGIFCASFYHFFVNDQTGPIGAMLRATFPETVRMGLDEATFAAVLVSLFMQIMGLLQMPDFFGPSFSPFVLTKLRSWQSTASSSKLNSSRQKAQQAVVNKTKVKKT